MSNEGKLEKKQVGIRVELDMHMKVLRGYRHDGDQHVTDAYLRALEEAVRSVRLTVGDVKEIEKMKAANGQRRQEKRAKKRNAK